MSKHAHFLGQNLEKVIVGVFQPEPAIHFVTNAFGTCVYSHGNLTKSMEMKLSSVQINLPNIQAK